MSEFCDESLCKYKSQRCHGDLIDSINDLKYMVICFLIVLKAVFGKDHKMRWEG